MTTKTFKTYGKRSKRTVITLASPDKHAQPATSDTGATLTNLGHSAEWESPVRIIGSSRPFQRTEPSGKGPGLQRRKPRHFVTPKKKPRISALSIASVSRPVIAKRNTVKSTNDTQVGHSSHPPAQIATVLLRETDVNRVDDIDTDGHRDKGKPRRVAPTTKAKRRALVIISDSEDSGSSLTPSAAKENRKPSGFSGGRPDVVNAWADAGSDHPSTPVRRRVARNATRERTLRGSSKSQYAPQGSVLPDLGYRTAAGAGIQPIIDRDSDCDVNESVSATPCIDVIDLTSSPSLSSEVEPTSPSLSNLHSPSIPLPPFAQVQDLRLAVRHDGARFPQPGGSLSVWGRRPDSPAVRRNLVSLPSFDDILTSFSDLSVSITATATPTSEASPRPLEQPAIPPLSRLLEATGQEEPIDFETFVQTFPLKHYVDPMPYRKIGEASYSEVFGVGDIVLKVVPLLGDLTLSQTHGAEDRPAETSIEDVSREIFFMSKMGSLQGGSGFVALLGSYVVRGAFPAVLLSEWDRWDAEHGSESVRPDCFTHSQLFAVIEMAYFGVELEKYTFPKKNGWRQACSIFWQVAQSLERAERHLRFEHRDLHWGQVLISPVDHSAQDNNNSNNNNVPMDDPCHGVAVTLIDFGLSRMDGISPDDLPIYTTFEQEIFEGEGDYQFDVYRMMRDYIGTDWSTYRPMTNLMWLHYLSTKLLKNKGLRKPTLTSKDRRSHAALKKEVDCHACLTQVEAKLGAVMQACQLARKPKTRSAKALPPLTWECSGDLCCFARERGWIV